MQESHFPLFYQLTPFHPQDTHEMSQNIPFMVCTLSNMDVPFLASFFSNLPWAFSFWITKWSRTWTHENVSVSRNLNFKQILAYHLLLCSLKYVFLHTIAHYKPVYIYNILLTYTMGSAHRLNVQPLRIRFPKKKLFT